MVSEPKLLGGYKFKSHLMHIPPIHQAYVQVQEEGCPSGGIFRSLAQLSMIYIYIYVNWQLNSFFLNRKAFSVFCSLESHNQELSLELALECRKCSKDFGLAA